MVLDFAEAGEAEVIEVGIDDWGDEEGEEEAECLAADDDDGDGAAFFGAGAGTEGEGEHAGDEREGGHEDGAESVAVALEDGLVAFHALLAEVVHVVDLEDGVFLDDAEEDEEAEGGVEVEGIVGGEEGEEGEGEGEWEGEEDGEGVDEAFVLGGEDHVHEDYGEEEGPEEFGEGAFEFAAFTGDAGGVFGGQVHFGGGLAEGDEPVGEGVTGGDGAAEADLALSVDAIDAGGGDAGDEFDDVIESDEAAFASGDVEAGDGFLVIAGAFGEAELDIIGGVDAGVIEAGDLLVAADHDAEGGGDVLGIDAEVGGAGAVDFGTEFGFIEFEGDIGVEEAEVGGLEAEVFGVFAEFFEFGAEDGEVDFGAGAAGTDGGAHSADGDAEVGEVAELLSDL